MENHHVRVAIVGAGWAGAAAALTLSRAGISASVFEASKVAGGRARKVQHTDRVFDNGQHLLLGAYQRCVALIASVHGNPDLAMQRLPLALHTAPAIHASLHMAAPPVAAPWHLLSAILCADGLSISEKLTTCVWAAHWLNPKHTVSMESTVRDITCGLPPAVRNLLWDPLCVAALNTLPDEASARVFVEVMRRAFTESSRASDLLVPTVDLSAMFPEPALEEVTEHGGVVRFGEPVFALRKESSTISVTLRDETLTFDHVIVATGPQHVARLVEADPAYHALAAVLGKITYEPITTLHFEFAYVQPMPDVKRPMLMLNGLPGQWLFWRQQANGHWRASVVISAHHREDNREGLVAATLAQLNLSYQLPQPVWQFTVTEKRATYACTPVQSKMLGELPHRIGRVHFAGDWCVPELPATLEAAVISGEKAARSVITELSHD